MASWVDHPRDEFVIPLNSDVGATMASPEQGKRVRLRLGYYFN